MGGVVGGRVGIRGSRGEWGRGGEVEAVQSGAVFYPRKRCKSQGVGGVGEWVGGDWGEWELGGGVVGEEVVGRGVG